MAHSTPPYLSVGDRLINESPFQASARTVQKKCDILPSNSIDDGHIQ